MAVPAGASEQKNIALRDAVNCDVSDGTNALIGAWQTRATGAPFVAHVFTFHSDGTMLMSGPPEGNPKTSLSNGIGPWKKVEGNSYVARFVEIAANRESAAFAGTVVVDLNIDVSCSKFTASAVTNYYEAGGSHAEGPFDAKLDGTRIKLP